MAIREEDKEDYAACCKIEEDSQKEFDKLCIYLSAGALSLTLTFIEKIVPRTEASVLWLLILAWALWVLSLVFSFGSQYWSARAARKCIEAMRNGKTYTEAYQLSKDEITGKLNLWALIAFLVGVAIIVVYVSINLY